MMSEEMIVRLLIKELRDAMNAEHYYESYGVIDNAARIAHEIVNG